MQHTAKLIDEAKNQLPDPPSKTEKPIPLQMADRALPPWALILGILFTVSQQIFVFSLPILGAVFISIVAQRGELAMIPVLTVIGLVALLCLLFIQFAHQKTLAGFRNLRELHSNKISAACSFLVFFVLTVVHPLAGIPILAGVIFGWICHYLLRRLGRSETGWEFLPEEAVSLLSGRDHSGLKLAETAPEHHQLALPVNFCALGLTVILSFAMGSYLLAEDVITNLALFPLLLSSLWSVENCMRLFSLHFSAPRTSVIGASEVRENSPKSDEDEFGLCVSNLNAIDASGNSKLSNLNFNCPPGSITGIIGETGAGKSLLLQSLADPFALDSMDVSGCIRLNSKDLWVRSSARQDAMVAYLPDRPILLPASGEENLTCFQTDPVKERGRALLEQLVFSSEVVDTICAQQNAQRLPRSQAQTLAIARALLVGPELYLMDRPEDGLNEKQISAVVDRLKQETSLGRTVLLATDNRQFLELCDRLIVMQYGQIIDHGPAELVRERISTGWSRFIAPRQLETEENLTRWIHSHFRRGTEETNKRRVARVASDMLTFACQKADPSWPGLVTFSFKHFEGYCALKVEDQDPPISSAQFERARRATKEASFSKDIAPLAALFQNCLEVEKDTKQDHRLLMVKVKTFDPRKANSGPADVQTQRA